MHKISKMAVSILNNNETEHIKEIYIKCKIW